MIKCKAHRATSTLRTGFALGVCIVLGAPAPQAMAQDALEPQGTRLDIAMGLKGGLTGSFMTREVPETATYTLDDGSTLSDYDTDYFPLFGLGGDVGFTLDVRAFGIVGLETGARVSFDNGRGWNDERFSGSDDILYRLFQEQRGTSLRVPLLLKVSTAQGMVRPVAGVGFEFVRQLDVTSEYRAENDTGNGSSEAMLRNMQNSVVPANYRLGTFVVGLEFNFGAVRIPLEVRGQYNFGFDEADRVRAGGTAGDPSFEADGAFEGHFGISLGVIYNYSLFM
ncbi:MAG: hypothetical protein AAGI01_07640 [Myxococcota bacterium]